jgi:hypothetical protein
MEVKTRVVTAVDVKIPTRLYYESNMSNHDQGTQIQISPNDMFYHVKCYMNFSRHRQESMCL